MRDPKIARFRTRPAEDSTLEAQATRVGHLVAALGQGRVAVKIPGLAEPLPARIAVPLTAARLEAAIQSQQEAVVIFEGRSLKRPIVIGLIEPYLAQTPLAAPPPAPDTPQTTGRSEGEPTVDARVDNPSAGERPVNAVLDNGAGQPPVDALGSTGQLAVNATDSTAAQPSVHTTDSAAAAAHPPIDALVDGKRVKIVGADEIV